jgi:hypothetical protein
MMDSTHPAGSAEFLSRLHDGELTSKEQSTFESHRAVCNACREAVAEFERSLSAFRTAPSAPVPSDLSARILRKIRAQSPSRRPFGVMFGIDIRWAGVFMAALLVAIIAPALFFRRELPQNARPPDTISAHIVEAEADETAALAEEPDAPKRNAPKAPEAKTRAQPKQEQQGARGRVAESPPLPASVPAPAENAVDEVAQKPQAAREEGPAPSALSKRAIASAERSGGEAGAFGTELKAAEKIRLEVRALDGEGQPPAIHEAPSDERLSSLRGQEFILIVEAAGHVRGVSAVGPETESARRKDSVASADGSAVASHDLLRELRFVPGGRPRRLLVRVQ